jgi:hypothetical protein
VVDSTEFEVRETFPLQMKPFKSEYHTMQILRLRKGQLLIVDSSFESKGKHLQMELFSVKQKRTIGLEELDLGGEEVVTSISYSPEYRKMVVCDQGENWKVFEFKKTFKDPMKSEIQRMESKKVDFEGYISRVIMNKTNRIFIMGTSKGDILFVEADTMKLNRRIGGNQYITHLMACEQSRDTCLYIIEKQSRDMAKFILEPVLGNLIMERYEDKNPIYYRGSGNT